MGLKCPSLWRCDLHGTNGAQVMVSWLLPFFFFFLLRIYIRVEKKGKSVKLATFYLGGMIVRFLFLYFLCI